MNDRFQQISLIDMTETCLIVSDLPGACVTIWSWGRVPDVAQDPAHEAARILVDAGAYSFEQIEVLAVLSSCGDMGCTAGQVAHIVRASSEEALARLVSLKALNLTVSSSDQPVHWRVTQDRPALGAAIELLAEVMRRDRQRVVNHFYSERLKQMRAFADSFRIRKDDT